MSRRDSALKKKEGNSEEKGKPGEDQGYQSKIILELQQEHSLKTIKNMSSKIHFIAEFVFGTIFFQFFDDTKDLGLNVHPRRSLYQHLWVIAQYMLAGNYDEK